MPTAEQWLAFQKMGDFNQDGYIDQADLDLITPHYGETASSPNWNPLFDVYTDGKIDMKDIAICANNQGLNIWDTFPTQYVLGISSGLGGVTDPPNGSYTYNEGTVVNVTAYPAAGYVFDYWAYDAISYENPISITINENRTLYPFFKSSAPPPPPSVSLVTVSVAGQGATDPTVGEHVYTLGSALYVTAIAAAGWHYATMKRNGVDWTSANPGEFLNLAEVEAIEVVFEEDPAPPPPGISNLTISVNGQGTTDPSAGIHTDRNIGSNLVVTAFPASGWKYVHMKRNGVVWTDANPGEFLDLAATEVITVVFSGPSKTCPFPGLKRWPRLYQLICSLWP